MSFKMALMAMKALKAHARKKSLEEMMSDSEDDEAALGTHLDETTDNPTTKDDMADDEDFEPYKPFKAPPVSEKMEIVVAAPRSKNAVQEAIDEVEPDAKKRGGWPKGKSRK